MDISEQPGIRFERVFLTELNFSVAKKIPEKLSYELGIDYNGSLTPKENPDTLFAEIKVNLAEDVSEPPFIFNFKLVGIFKQIKGKENLSLEEFSKKQAPALLIPYVREIISNITSRTSLPVLIIPPINVFALLEKKGSDAKVETSEKQIELEHKSDN